MIPIQRILSLCLPLRMAYYASLSRKLLRNVHEIDTKFFHSVSPFKKRGEYTIITVLGTQWNLFVESSHSETPIRSFLIFCLPLKERGEHSIITLLGTQWPIQKTLLCVYLKMILYTIEGKRWAYCNHCIRYSMTLIRRIQTFHDTDRSFLIFCLF